MSKDAVKCGVLIVGSGGSAMSVAVRLREANITDVRMISKHRDFGGVWYQNTYPNCGVDGPVTYYQFSYAPTGDWSQHYASQPELLEYFRRVARTYDLYQLIDFDTEMTNAVWNAEQSFWEVETDRGLYHASHLVMATGFLDAPNVVQLPGHETFKGRIFHSSIWPEGYTGEGDRIAVVGTGSSALQIVPGLQPFAKDVLVFQRTPTWITPMNNRPLTEDERRLYNEDHAEVERLRKESEVAASESFVKVFRAEDPDAAARVEADALAYLHAQVSDPDLRKLLTPTHRYGCKRPGVSDTYYAALTQPNVELIPEAASHIGPNTITSTGGREFKVDTIILATGFHWGTHILQRIKRRDGRTIAEAQAGHPRAYKSISVSNCPNLYLVGGPAPNGRPGNGLRAGEWGGVYVARAIQHMHNRGIAALEVLEQAESEWKRQADEVLANGPSLSGECINYITDAVGANVADWPYTLEDMRVQLSQFDPGVYQVPTRVLAPAL
ncbi:NAD(P)/FAD-dependent oxidoreductase [Rhizobium sp. 16-449-1b]|uniref:flavin-containing monooxygenase n=1 Tax=Rhizobium sp. 16-449-1b TaxID=2819989 RepID=UPI001ADC789B|nr:NAD(P)/FAD-dependent oxidoreductase [Rhizobium sp. 16-449-1b]MBO9198467.1 NAD(P)/FAD-dependent oxidoreductase [Rhizobium sp. 16-449-1b]